MFEKKISDEEKKKQVREAKRVAKKGEKKDTGVGIKMVTVLKVVILPMLFAGIIVCALYLAMQNKLEAESLKGQVLVMKQDVAVNTYIKDTDADKYFEVISVELTAIPDCAYKSISELPKNGFYVENNMAKTQMVMKDDIVSKDLVMDKYKNGYEVTSFPTESFDDSVNGALRKGDIVDVYALDPATEMLVLMAQNVYVSDVYDNAGNKITEPEQVATSFTVWVTPDEVENINTAIVYGGVQIYLKVE